MANEALKLPDGTPFEFREDRTTYARVHHVACESPAASDENPGTEAKPFKTIGRAAAALRPGEKVVIHGGVYREQVSPARGGDGPDRMIAYEAAPGERPVVRGSRLWKPEFVPSTGWAMRNPSDTQVWMADIPAEFFNAYNPFLARNIPDHFFTFKYPWYENERERESALRRRGMVFFQGRALRQVLWFRQLADGDGSFWPEDPGTRIHLRLPGDIDPRGAELEVTVQEQLFAPRERYLGYIRVSGLAFEHAADGVPVPQRAAVSTNRGHHWIIEDCVIRHANAVCLDVGAQDWRAADKDRSGAHVIRRNIISDCGICGLAGAGGVDDTLVEGNVFERIGGLDFEHNYESAGLKFHTCANVVIRGNVFRHIRAAGGLWLDCSIKNCRVSGNLFADIETCTAAVYIECAHFPNLVAGNVLSDVRGPTKPGGVGTDGGIGIRVDCGEGGIVANNLLAGVRNEFAISMNLIQAERVMDGRVGLCRRQRVLNNIITNCPKRIQFGRADENLADGNLFDAGRDAAVFEVSWPAPKAVLNLEGWRTFWGFDRSGATAQITAAIDPDALVMTLKVEGDSPTCREVPELHDDSWRRPGLLTPDDWAALLAGREVRVRLCEFCRV